MEFIVDLNRLSCTQNSPFSRNRPFRPHSHTQQHLCDTVTGFKIIIHHKCFKAFQLHNPFLFLISRNKPKLQLNNKFASFSLLCHQIDGPAHHINNIFCNGHAKTGSLYPAYRRSPFPFERIEDLLCKLFTHTDTGIFDADLIASLALRCIWKLGYTYRHHTSGSREFNGIGQ